MRNKFTFLAVLLVGCSSSETPVDPPAAPVELTIQYVERLPQIDFVTGSANPRVEGWPTVGQQVTWRAHIRNWATTELSVPFRWMLDGVELSRGSVKIAANAVGTADYVAPWAFTRHKLAFEVDPANTITEEEEQNNSVTVNTDALSIGFYVEQGVYDYFRANQQKLAGAHSTSFEDWAQRQIVRYNELFETAIYPETPSGVLDRVRLDKITIVPNGSLPLAGTEGAGYDPPQAVPNRNDKTVDLQWGFPQSQLQVYVDGGFSTSSNNQFFYSGFMQHEVGHARYLIDVYTFDVRSGLPGEQVDIREGGQPVAGSIYMPGTVVNNKGLLLHKANYQGLMNADWTVMDRYSAIALNLIAGQRPRFANFNSPPNLGEFLNDLPAENIVRLIDPSGNPIANAEVKVFRSGPHPSPIPSGSFYIKYFDNTPDMSLSSDGSGEIRLGRNPFTAGEPIVADNDFYTRGVIIVRVAAAGKVGYAFLESADFNIAYWKGQTALGRYDLRVNLL